MKSLTRRNFIRNVSIGAAGTMILPTILPSCAKGANGRILIAHIGVGSRGLDELKGYFLNIPQSAYSVATCDPFQDRRESVAKLVNAHYLKLALNAPECKSYLDFDEVLQRKDIDAVVIDTPDHWHVPAAIKAARAGKHIMLAKPLGLSYRDFMTLKNELAENDVRFHYGTQQRSMKHIQLGIEMIRSGEIGEIEKVDVWAPGLNPVQSPVCNEAAVPQGFDYERWSGPAPLNPYCPERVTNNGSWFQWDYSIGFLAGWGAHPLDVMVWGIKEKVNGIYSCDGAGDFWQPGGIYNNVMSWNLNYVYESGIKLRFFSTDVAEKNDLLAYREKKEGNGTTFYGKKGWISLSRSSAQSDIAELNEKLNNFPKNSNGWINSDEGLMGQMFADVVTGKIKETCPIDDAIISDCISHVGNITIRAGRKITWNPTTGETVSDPEAMKWFTRDLRSPYTI